MPRLGKGLESSGRLRVRTRKDFIKKNLGRGLLADSVFATNSGTYNRDKLSRCLTMFLEMACSYPPRFVVARASRNKTFMVGVIRSQSIIGSKETSSDRIKPY